eukprot:3202545-Prymnesium_polylepis.1
MEHPERSRGSREREDRSRGRRRESYQSSRRAVRSHRERRGRRRERGDDVKDECEPRSRRERSFGEQKVETEARKAAVAAEGSAHISTERLALKNKVGSGLCETAKQIDDRHLQTKQPEVPRAHRPRAKSSCGTRCRRSVEGSDKKVHGEKQVEIVVVDVSSSVTEEEEAGREEVGCETHDGSHACAKG